jgi:hypothetical protein
MMVFTTSRMLAPLVNWYSPYEIVPCSQRRAGYEQVWLIDHASRAQLTPHALRGMLTVCRRENRQFARAPSEANAGAIVSRRISAELPTITNGCRAAATASSGPQHARLQRGTRTRGVMRAVPERIGG